MPKKAKKFDQLTEDDIFKSEYMQALNDKFKLRGQLAALIDQLEELLARNDRLADSITEKKNPKPVEIPTPSRPVKSVLPTTSPPAATPATSKLPPPHHQAVQTIQPEPPSLFLNSPIRGLPPITTGQPFTLPTEPLTPNVSPTTTASRSKDIAKEDFKDEGIDVDDDIVAVLRSKRPPMTINNDALENELDRLKKRFDEVTFYAIVIIFALFSIMMLKELRLLLLSKTQSVKEASPATTNVVCPTASSCPANKGDGMAGKEQVQLNVKLESKEYPRNSGNNFPKIPPCPKSGPSSMNQRISVKAMPPYESRPVIEVKCGELGTMRYSEYYDCEECNMNLMS